MPMFRRSLVAALFAFATALVAPALAQEAPDALAKRVASEVVQLIKADPKLAAGDPGRVRDVIETKLLPHFDFSRMTRLAMGRNWNRASPEQQTKLTNEFRTLLVRTYSNAITQYQDEKIEIKPMRDPPNAEEVTVRSEVIRPGRQPVQIDYGMVRTPQGWKVYDVIVGGVSLVTNYRDEFHEQIKASGVDGLIKTLAEKNRTGSK